MKGEKFLAWLSSTEKISDYKELANSIWVKLVAIKLKEHAVA